MTGNNQKWVGLCGLLVNRVKVGGDEVPSNEQDYL